MAPAIVRRTRRNHGLEHATIHVLTQHHKGFSAQGNSTPNGFHLNIYGDVAAADVAAAVDEAHQRLKAGERHLAVHPNCGTVLVTTAALTTLAAQTMLAVEQRREPKGKSPLSLLFNALPGAMVAVLAALVVSRPLGMQFQARYTVDGELGDLEVVSVRPAPPSLVTRLFQLLLTGGKLPPTSYFVATRGG